MAWGGRSSLKVYGQLSYVRIAGILEDKDEVLIADGRSKNYAVRSMSYVHPVTHKYEPAMCMRLYRTDILQYFRDGTVIVDDYNSSLTRTYTSRYGPIQVSTENGYQVFRDLYGEWWPMRKPIVILPNGLVQDVVITSKQRVKPELKAERRQIGKHLREAAFGRLALGEFSGLIEPGWYARVPRIDEHRRPLFKLLNEQADHASIARYAEQTVRLGASTYGRRRGETQHADPIAATEALLSALLRTELDAPEWYERLSSEHRGIRVRAA